MLTSLLHLTEEKAKTKIKKAGLKVIVRSRNGVTLAGDQSAPANRIDLFITDDVVTKVVGNIVDKKKSDSNQPYGCDDVAGHVMECIQAGLHLQEKIDNMCANCGH
ncbi:MAG TPA: hypothetical protein VII94_04565 [Candidatus Saccharimonadales bacterium]